MAQGSWFEQSAFVISFALFEYCERSGDPSLSALRREGIKTMQL